jgi:iron(III) transport system ATP-binding protein
MGVLLSVRDLTLAHGKQPVVSHANFDLQAGEIACLMGPSGCGKTTLLRAIAGLHALGDGQIFLRGEEIANSRTQRSPEARKLSFVFQDLALFPHLNVAENIGLGLQQLSRSARQARVTHLLQQFDLESLRARFAHELSGGQQQRVALARALAPEHDLILLDEPFSSLDAQLRVALSRDLRRSLKASGAAAILVSHDQEEGLVCADQIGVMQAGSIQQWGSPYDVYCQPKTEFVGQFVGESSWLPAHIKSNVLHSLLGKIELETAQHADQNVRLLVRPEDLCFDEFGLSADVLHSEFRGAYTVYRLKIGEQQLSMSASDPTLLLDGQTLRIAFKPRALRFFPA